MGRCNEDGRWFSPAEICVSLQLWESRASVTPGWFADVVFPSHTCLVMLFEESAAQSRISQLLTLSHSCYKAVTSKGQLKGDVCREKKEKENKRIRLSVCPFFSVHDITGLRCFGITASQWVIFPFLLYENHEKTHQNLPVRKKTAAWSQSRCFHLRVGLSKSRQMTFHSLSRVLGSSWTDVQDSGPQVFILGLSEVAHAKALLLPAADPVRVNRKISEG